MYVCNVYDKLVYVHIYTLHTYIHTSLSRLWETANTAQELYGMMYMHVQIKGTKTKNPDNWQLPGTALLKLWIRTTKCFRVMGSDILYFLSCFLKPHNLSQ